MMQLTFEVIRARMTTVAPSGTQMSPAQTWTKSGRHFRCDIDPLRDELKFAQAGATTIATHICHFFADADILPKDRIQIYSSKRLAGPIGSWYLITEVVEPTETIAYQRAYAIISSNPGV